MEGPDTADTQIFADCTVYQGFAPSYAEFSVAEDGTVAIQEDVAGCMFTLPLDPPPLYRLRPAWSVKAKRKI